MEKKRKTWIPSLIWGLAAAGAVWALWAILGLPFSDAWYLAIPTAGSILAFRGTWFAVKKKQLRREAEKAEADAAAAALQEKERLAREADAALSPQQKEILEEGRVALGELGKLYARIPEESVRSRIMALLSLTDRIVEDIRTDPSDLPLIRRFLRYYLPTTIRVLHEYDRSQVDRSKLETMLDQVIESSQTQYDGLFANNATDLDLEIGALETKLRAEGLSAPDFRIPD
ncbi:MAG: 5-bromo-4-chloroindolyl phosphate hydrolysis family protein [Oscillospiraceae bacterium]|nr:5-bromo-4-chloroindolyl phosphate hydrolysis family protein [Oscillospiraceae bacterium]